MIKRSDQAVRDARSVLNAKNWQSRFCVQWLTLQSSTMDFKIHIFFYVSIYYLHLHYFSPRQRPETMPVIFIQFTLVEMIHE